LLNCWTLWAGYWRAGPVMREPGRGWRRAASLYVLCAGMLMITLDTTIVNVALPGIQQDLQLSAGGLAWVVNAYLVAAGGLLLLAGRLGDLAGRRRVFLGGIAVFTLASVSCGLAPNGTVLIAARFAQGAGGAMSAAVIVGMIVTMFPQRGEQARAIGIFSFTAAAGGAIGLLAGGVLTQALNWHWIFLVNAPLGTVTALAACWFLDADDRECHLAGADIPGAVLVTAALMLGVYTIVQRAAADGWQAHSTLLCAAGSLALAAGFGVREAKAGNPLMPLRFFASRQVAAAGVIEVIGSAGMLGTFFLGALYFQRVAGYSPVQTGLAFLPATALMAVTALRYAEPLAVRLGGRRTVLTGLTLMTAGYALRAQLPVHPSYLANVLPSMALTGIGAGAGFPALTGVAMSGAGSSDAGLASGLISTAGQIGGALGLAILAAVSSAGAKALSAAGASLPASLDGGYDRAFWVAAALTLAAVLVAAVALPGHAPARRSPPRAGGARQAQTALSYPTEKASS
jgi:EmrB/QacA subfamily drug resistance transporter